METNHDRADDGDWRRPAGRAATPARTVRARGAGQPGSSTTTAAPMVAVCQCGQVGCEPDVAGVEAGGRRRRLTDRNLTRTDRRPGGPCGGRRGVFRFNGGMVGAVGGCGRNRRPRRQPRVPGTTKGSRLHGSPRFYTNHPTADSSRISARLDGNLRHADSQHEGPCPMLRQRTTTGFIVNADTGDERRPPAALHGREGVARLDWPAWLKRTSRLHRRNGSQGGPGRNRLRGQSRAAVPVGAPLRLGSVRADRARGADACMDMRRADRHRAARAPSRSRATRTNQRLKSFKWIPGL